MNDEITAKYEAIKQRVLEASDGFSRGMLAQTSAPR